MIIRVMMVEETSPPTMGAAIRFMTSEPVPVPIITGRRQEIIQKLADELTQKHSIKVKVVIAELSDDNDVQRVIDAISTSDNDSVPIPSFVNISRRRQ